MTNLLIIVILALLMIPLSAFAQNPGPQLNETQEIDNALMSILKPVHEKSIKNPDKGYLIILSDSEWQATIMDSGNDFTTIDGFKTKTLEFECVPGFLSTYSVSVQLQTESGKVLFIAYYQDGKYLDKGATTSQYGLVSLSGECNTEG